GRIAILRPVLHLIDRHGGRLLRSVGQSIPRLCRASVRVLGGIEAPVDTTPIRRSTSLLSTLKGLKSFGIWAFGARFGELFGRDATKAALPHREVARLSGPRAQEG